MKNEDAEVVVVLGAIFHDLGMTVIRRRHELFGAMLAWNFIDKLLQTFQPAEVVFQKGRARGATQCRFA